MLVGTARGLGPCGQRQLNSRNSPHPPLATRYRHQAPAAAWPIPPPSLLPGRAHYLPLRSVVLIQGSPVHKTHGGSCSCPRPSAPAARPLGGLSCTANARGASTTPVAGPFKYGNLQPSLPTVGGRAAQLRTCGANGGAAAAAGDCGRSSLGSSSNDTQSESAASTSDPNASAVAAAQLLRGALEAALLPRLEAMEGRIMQSVGDMEVRIVKRMGKQEQQGEEKAETREGQLTSAPEALAAARRDHGEGHAQLDQGQEQEQAQAPEQEQALAVTLAALEQRLREELKAEVAALRSELLAREQQQMVAAAAAAAGPTQANNIQQQAKVQAGSGARASSGVGRMWAAACNACARVLRRTMLNGLNIALMVIPSAVLFAVFIKCLFWTLQLLQVIPS